MSHALLLDSLERAGPRDAAALTDRVRSAEYDPVGACWLPPEAWAASYVPLERRRDLLPEEDLTRAFRAAIALWRAHGGDYGYRLIVARPG
jgi:hypothetical protein